MQQLEAASLGDRGMIYVPNMPYATKPVSVGYQFSTLMLLPEQASSWVGILEQLRIGTEQTAIQVDIEQLRAVLPQLRDVGSSCWRIAGTPPPALCAPVNSWVLGR